MMTDEDLMNAVKNEHLARIDKDGNLEFFSMDVLKKRVADFDRGDKDTLNSWCKLISLLLAPNEHEGVSK